MSATTTSPHSSMSLKDWLTIIVSLLSLAKMIYDLFTNSSLYVFLIALIVFIISGAYYLFTLYKKENYKTLLKFFLAFYVVSVSFSLGGSWYYYTQYDPDGFPIEKIKNTIYPYEGPDQAAQKGSAYLAVSNSYESLQRFVTSYDLEYTIPDAPDTYAGFSIEFFQPADLSHYTNLRLKIKYDDPNALVRLALKDDAKNSEDVLLDSKFVKGDKTALQTITVPLSLFQQINLSNVREFVIDANSEFINGDHEVWISEIHFVK